jgi:hypothetical protein
MMINNLLQTNDRTYSDPNFIVLLETHMTLLRTTNISVISVSSHQNYKYEGDLYGLLDDLNIIKDHHFIVARINGYDNSADFKGNVEYLVLPDFNEITLLKNIFQSKNLF